MPETGLQITTPAASLVRITPSCIPTHLTPEGTEKKINDREVEGSQELGERRAGQTCAPPRISSVILNESPNFSLQPQPQFPYL